MRLLDRLARVFRGPRSFDSVAAELSTGLRRGSVTLGPPRVGDANPVSPRAGDPARPGAVPTSEGTGTTAAAGVKV